MFLHTRPDLGIVKVESSLHCQSNYENIQDLKIMTISLAVSVVLSISATDVRQ